MKIIGILRFEFDYQRRRPYTWLCAAALVLVSFLFVRQNYLADALYADFFVNSPFVIASVTVFGSMFWFLTGALTAGELAARDVDARMHPLTYTAPLTTVEYLGGRFLAALLLNVLTIMAVPLSVLLAVYAPGIADQAVGPFRPAAYLTALAYIALPNVFVSTAIQFSFAALARRPIAAFMGSLLIFFIAYGGMIAVGLFGGGQDVATLLDVFGHVFITSDLVLNWTPIEKSTRLIELRGTPLIASRLLWLGIASSALAFTYARFRFAECAPWGTGLGSRLSIGWRPRPRPIEPASPPRDDAAMPRVDPSFGPAVRAAQTLTIAWTSGRAVLLGWSGLPLQFLLAALVVVVLPQNLQNMGTPLLPRTEYLLTFLTAPLTSAFTPWVVTPLLIILYAGELVWRERNAGLGELTDSAPIPEWALFLGRFIGLTAGLAAWTLLLAAAGVLVQVRTGYDRHELGLFLEVLLGLQLPEYLLFAVLALVVQGLVAHRYVGHLLALVSYAFILFAAGLGIEHHMLVFGSAPRWYYSDIRGFGPSLGPWRWFMAYWTAWALLLAVAAQLFWVRGTDTGTRSRLRLARLRGTAATAWAGAVALLLIAGLGGFVFYNTNVLNTYRSRADAVRLRADYERHYSRYAEVPQPAMTATVLHVELFPRRQAVDIRGSYVLVNRTARAIRTIHLATAPTVDTGPIVFKPDAREVVVDRERGHRIYDLLRPLQPGESVELQFAVHAAPGGFRHDGVNPFMSANGTFFRNRDLLPVIGYQASRELMEPAQRRNHGLAARPLFPVLDDAEADAGGSGVQDFTGADRIAFEATIGTDADQVAVAPGTLRATWSSGGEGTSGGIRRRYFRYTTDSPVGNEYRFFSAAYAVHRERWKDIEVEVYHHPQHTAILDRMLRSVRHSLEYYTREFGPYQFPYIRLVENPGRGIGAHADAGTVDYTEGFSRFNPDGDERGLDLPFAVMAHEIAHQWWGAQLPYAFMEGAPLLIESAAWYSAMNVVEAAYGREHLERLRRFFRQPTPIPAIRQSVPLLRAMDPYAAYRKGPFALYAMREHIGAARVNLAFRRLLERHRSLDVPPATSLELYRELQAVTPPSSQPLLHDLFAANTYWDLRTVQATATKTSEATWQVTLQLSARKVTVDPSGVETDVPMDEPVQVGVFARGVEGPDYGKTLYLEPHRIRSGDQTIRLTVPGVPADAGIDPFHLLIEMERFDNVEKVELAEVTAR